ncbi:sporulation protein [Peribacillus alkalitolerans]|uniref:sporulation protein n=1 Tax=Peribacillus alkalitolerans TaxID=1550385 RepID=UPI0013D4AE4F|nr:sporulation protein [Peribacillus alkalitolerans]
MGNGKVVISLISLVVLALLSSCSKVDNVRDPISIYDIDLEYLENNSDSSIEAFMVKADDSVIGKKVDMLLHGDYTWFLNLLQKNKSEIFENQEPNSYSVNIVFTELNRSIDYLPGRYNGKKVSFYISKELTDKFIKIFINKNPVNTILKNNTISSNGKLEGVVTVSAGKRSIVLDRITLEMELPEEETPITWLITNNIEVLPNQVKKFPFTFKLPKITRSQESQDPIFLETVVEPFELYINDYEQLEFVK